MLRQPRQRVSAGTTPQSTRAWSSQPSSATIRSLSLFITEPILQVAARRTSSRPINSSWVRRCFRQRPGWSQRWRHMTRIAPKLVFYLHCATTTSRRLPVCRTLANMRRRAAFHALFTAVRDARSCKSIYTTWSVQASRRSCAASSPPPSSSFATDAAVTWDTILTTHETNRGVREWILVPILPHSHPVIPENNYFHFHSHPI